MTRHGVRIQLGAAANGGKKVGDVRRQVLYFELHVHGRGRVPLAFDLQLASPAEKHLPLRAIEFGAAVAVVGIVRAPEPLLIDEYSLASRLAVPRILIYEQRLWS